MPQEENARDWTLVQRFRKSRAATNTAANQRPAGGLARQAFGMSVEAPARGCGVRRWAAVGAQVVVVEVAHQRTTWAGTVVGTWAAPERVSLSHGGARPLQRRRRRQDSERHTPMAHRDRPPVDPKRCEKRVVWSRLGVDVRNSVCAGWLGQSEYHLRWPPRALGRDDGESTGGSCERERAEGTHHLHLGVGPGQASRQAAAGGRLSRGRWAAKGDTPPAASSLSLPAERCGVWLAGWPRRRLATVLPTPSNPSVCVPARWALGVVVHSG